MRHADRGLEIAELAVRHRDRGVVGFDIAGRRGRASRPSATATRSTSSPREFFPVTVHAGEADGLDSIRSALVRRPRAAPRPRRAHRRGHHRSSAQDDENTLRLARPARAVGARTARSRSRPARRRTCRPARSRRGATSSSTTRSTCSTSSASGSRSTPTTGCMSAHDAHAASSRCSATRSATTSTTSRCSSSTRPPSAFLPLDDREELVELITTVRRASVAARPMRPNGHAAPAASR